MKNKEKTHEQLIKEVTSLRQRIAELEASGRKRNQFEEDLRTERDKAQQYLDIAEVILVALNKKGEITLTNRKGNQILGYQEGELLGKNWFATCVPSHLRKKIKSGFLKLMAGKRRLTEFYENPVLTKSGTERIIAWHNTLLKDAQGNPIGTLSSGEDITKRKRAAEALRKSEERYKTLFDEAVVGICLTDAETGIIIDCNEAMASLVGRERTDLIGKPQKILHPPQDNKEAFSPTFKQHLTDKEGQILETQVITKSGDIREVEIKANLLELQGRKVLQGLFHDITEHKRAEEALREFETRFRTLFEAIPDTVLVHDDRGAILHINEIGAQRLEWSAKDLVGRNLREIVTPENAASIADHARETHKVGWNRFETTYISRSGWRTMAEVYEHPIVFGTKKAILSVARDITERKKADEALREKEETIRALVETSQDWIWSIDVQGIHTYSNPAVEKILGYPPDDLIGKSSLALMHEEDRRAVEAKLTQWIKEKSGWQNIILRWRHKDGSWRWLESNAVPMFDATGELVGFRGVDRDITERKQTEEALLNEKIFSDTIMDSSPGLFFVFDDQGNILRWNRNAEKFTEYSTQEISKMNVLDFVVPEDTKSATEAIQEVLNKGQASAEITVLSKSGKKIPFYLTGLRTSIENITCVVGSGFDISEIKEAEEALQRSYDQLQKTFISAINALASTVEMKDQYTAGHQPRVTQLSCAIAEEMGLSKDQIEGIRMAGLIHDIGKIVVPAEILNKPGPLTEVQYEMIKMHPQAGYDILQRIAFPWPVAQIVQQHHEMMDGSGYPQGLAGEGILPEARIMAVANVVEAMTAHRPYRPAYDIEEALAEISHNRGTKYDSAAVDACLRLFTERGFAFDSAQY